MASSEKPGRKIVKSLEQLGAHYTPEVQEQMQAARGDETDPLTSAEQVNVAYAIKEFPNELPNHSTRLAAAEAVGKMLTDREREGFMRGLTASGQLEEAAYESVAEDAGPVEHMSEAELIAGLEGLKPPEEAAEQNTAEDLSVDEVFENLKKMGAPEAIEAAGRSASAAPEVQRAKIFGSDAEKAIVDHAEAVAAAAARAIAQHASLPKGKHDRLRHEPGVTDEDQIPRGMKNKRHVTAFTDEDLVQKAKMPSPKPATQEVASLDTRAKLTAALGDPQGLIDRKIPFWRTADGAIVVLAGIKNGPRHGTRLGEGGYTAIDGKFYQHKDGELKRMTSGEVAEIRKQAKLDARKAYRERKDATTEAPKVDNEQTAPQEEPARDEESVSSTNEEFHEALAAFHDAYDPHDKTSTAPAFRDAIEGKSDIAIERLIANIHNKHKKNPKLYPSGLSLRNIWKGHAFEERDSGMHAEEAGRKDEQPRGPMQKRFNAKYDDDNLEEAYEYATRGNTKREIRQFIKKLEKADDIDQEELKRIVEEDTRISKEHTERTEKGKERDDAIRAEVAELVKARLEQLKS